MLDKYTDFSLKKSPKACMTISIDLISEARTSKASNRTSRNRSPQIKAPNIQSLLAKNYEDSYKRIKKKV